MPRGISPEIHRWLFAQVYEILVELREYEALEHSTSRGMLIKVLRAPDAKQKAEQSGVQEVEFGAFYESFAEVPVMRAEQDDDETCFEH